MIKIGVTGLLCSGKDTFASYLKSKGFEHISLSDMLREELKKNNLEITRENLQKIGNELRKTRGNDILARLALEKMEPNKKYVITSIRNPLEVKKLASSKNFVLVNIDSSIETRFKRMQLRQRNEKDPSSFEEFIASEAKELTPKEESGQNLTACIKMARIIINNDSNEEEFYKKIDETMPKIEEIALFTRPNWEEYFMEMTRVIGKRGTCDRGRSGCLIVKNKRILTSGYVGAPPNLSHCDEIGHWFKKVIHEDGSITQHCIRTVHAEANAIAQAAKMGINIDGATIYCKMEPCLDCTKLLISAGIKRVVCEKKYHAAKEAREMMEEAGIELQALYNETEKYEGQKG